MSRARPLPRALAACFAALLLLLGAGVAHAAAPAPDDAPAPADARSEVVGDPEGPTYVVGTSISFAPFEFREPGGDFVGIDVDLMDAIGRDQGFQVEFRPLAFNAMLQALSAGQVDGAIAAMGITPEREQIYDFSDPYFSGELSLAVVEGDDRVRDWEDLEGRVLVVKTGSLSEEAARERQDEYGFELRPLDETTTMVQTLKAGSADALMDDEPVLAYGITQGSGLELVGERVDAGEYGFAVAKGENQELLRMFNEGLANVQASGEYDAIVDRYTAPDGEAAGQSSFFGMAAGVMPALLDGLKNTLLVTVISFALAMALGLLFGFWKISSVAPLRWIAVAFISVFRGTPLLVWAFFFYFGLPQLIGTPVNIWVAGVLTLALNGAAYIAEIVRGAVQSVPAGQMEAARSLGLPHSLSMRRVVLPQAFTLMTPSLINQLVIMIKDSSLLLAIGFAELLYQAQQVYAANYRVTEVLLIAAALYFVTITLLTTLANAVDRKVNA